jgi:hypothetical protein
MGVNLPKLADALPDDTEWAEDELEALIARIADVPEPSGAVTGAARAMLVAGRFVIKGQREGHSGYRYRKNPNPPNPLNPLEQQGITHQRAVDDELAKLRQINEAERQAEETLNGPVRQAAEVAFRAQIIPVLVEFGLIPADTPIPTMPGRRLTYTGPPQPGSPAWERGFGLGR